jgi:hypothetical protein
MGVDPNNFIPWNGRMNNSLVSQGVYIYALDVIAFDDQAYRFSGDLTLIR